MSYFLVKHNSVEFNDLTLVKKKVYLIVVIVIW